MANGNFSKFHGRDGSRSPESSPFHWSADMDETAELPDLSQDTPDTGETCDPLEDYLGKVKPEPDPANPSAMPEVDFHNLTDEDLTDFSWLNIPELSSLELENEMPMDSLSKEPTEEEAIEQAFRQTAEKPRSRKPNPVSRFWAAKRKAILTTVSAVFLILAAVGIFTQVYPRISDPYNHKILNGVTIAGCHVGGMTRKDAEQAVTDTVLPVLSETDMVISLPRQTVTLAHQNVDISLDVKAAVREAYRHGRTGSRDMQEEAYRNSLVNSHAVDLVPFLQVNDSYIRGQLQTYTITHKSVFTPSSYALEGDQPPLDFKKFHKDNTCQTLLLNLGTPSDELDYDTVRLPILQAYSNLQSAVTITPEQTGTLPEPLDLEKILADVSIAPVNSDLDPDTFEVISGSYGYTFDIELAKQLVSQAHYGDTVRVPMIYQAPEVMDSDVLYQDVLGQAETPYSSNPGRVRNLELACQAINGLILMPGDEFSFNETLGQRTSEKGYQPAPAYSGNRLVDSVGGGICQVSSTLYYSAMLADMEITDRINHGFLPTYIPAGMDATVSWEEPDFRFRNSMDFPIKLKAAAADGKVTVQILGTDNRDYYVKIEAKDSVTPHGVTYEEHGPEENYSDGEVIQDGIDGHNVKTYRCRYSKETNELISRDREAVSNYPARPSIVASVPAPPVTAPAETPEPTVPPETQTPPAPPETLPGEDSGGSTEPPAGPQEPAEPEGGSTPEVQEPAVPENT